MKKVVTINLNGNAHQVDEDGYSHLKAYLDDATRKLAGNPDRDEIIADIEESIAARCRASLTSHRTVVTGLAVEKIVAEMGPVDGDVSESKSRPRRLYRLTEGAQLSGVCNGLAAYLGIDVALVRTVVLVLALFSGGVVVVVYILCDLILPKATTEEEFLAAHGDPGTASDALRRAGEGLLGRGPNPLTGSFRNVGILLCGFAAFSLLSLFSVRAAAYLITMVDRHPWMAFAVVILTFVLVLRLLRHRATRRQ